jgi:threonine dehydrogenase-like Zn-dependent dehydrogenase
MRATVMYGAGDVHVENVPDPAVIEPTDAVVPEAIGVVEAVGADVRTLKIGDVVVIPFAFSDGTCVFN